MRTNRPRHVELPPDTRLVGWTREADSRPILECTACGRDYVGARICPLCDARRMMAEERQAGLREVSR